MTGQLNGPGWNFAHESITRAAWNSETRTLPVDDLAVSCPAAFMKISEQEESL